MAPSGAEGMNAISAMSAVRTLHDGCQCSGWCCEMDKHSFVPTSNRPLGCKKTRRRRQRRVPWSPTVVERLDWTLALYEGLGWRTVCIMNEGGLKGYSAGSRMRPWNKPPCQAAQLP